MTHYDLYEHKIHSNFAGDGIETAIVEDGVIVGLARGWDDPSVESDPVGLAVLKESIIGLDIDVAQAYETWTRLSPEAEENAQSWAIDVLEAEVD